MTGEDLSPRTRISQSMSDEALMRSSFGRALLSMLRKDLPPDAYERFVSSLRLYRSRQATSTTDSQPSSES